MIKGLPVLAIENKNTIKILAIFGNVAFMGQERANVFVLDQLQKTGKVQCLLAVNDRGVQWHVQPHLEAAGLSFVKMRFCWNIRKTFNPRNWWRYFRDTVKGNFQFYRIWKNFRPDYIHCGNSFQMMTLFPSVCLINTPIVFRLGDDPYTKYFVYRLLWRWIAKRVNHFVCISKFITKRLNDVLDINRKVSIIYNLPPQRFLHEIGQDLIPGENNKIFTVAYIGQISADKGVDLLISAGIEFVEEHTNVRFIIAGNLEHNEMGRQLVELVNRLDLSGKIFFTGVIENIPKLLAISNVHICPSVCNEGLSNVVGEAKLVGKPSIIFPSGGLPELVTHGVDGYVCKEKSEEGIIDALKYYYNLPDWGRKQGEAALYSMQSLGMTSDAFLHAWSSVYKLPDSSNV